MRNFRSGLRRLRRDQAGGMAVMLALSLLPLSLAAISAVDLIRGLGTRNHLQDALDAAALAVARSDAVTADQVLAIGRRVLALNLGPDVQVASNFTLNDQGVVIATASTVSPTALYKPLTGADLTVDAHSEVTRSSNNVELAMVLDVTGSMKGTKLQDLKSAAISLIDLVVKDQQTPYYSRAALIPYSNVVNPGGYLGNVRNPLEWGTGADVPGKQWMTFQNANREWVTFRGTDCVTERTDQNQFNDVAPVKVGTKLKNTVGYHYLPQGSACLASQIVPLTSNKTTLKNTIGAFKAEGSTAGHIGLAWGWYAVSPNWAAIWPADVKPHPYRERKLIKAIVLMTDGEFNTAYHNGVIARDSGSGSGGAQDHHIGDADNGSSFSQADRLCAAVKAQGVLIYSVGFALKDRDAITIMNRCASKPEYVYLPNSGADLKQAFRDIGQDINNLRISK